MKLSSLLPSLQLSLRAALAGGLAVGIAQLLRLQYPLYALVATVLVTDLSPAQTRRSGVTRLIGTVLGAALGAALGSLGLSGPLMVGLSIFAAMVLSYLFHLRDAARVAGYVCGIVVLNHGAEAWSYAFHRTCETVLGICLAILVSLVPRLISIDEANIHEE